MDDKPLTLDRREWGSILDRIQHSRWPDWEASRGSDWAAGVPIGFMRRAASYWGTSYSIDRAAGRWNAHRQGFVTIEDVPIHVVQVGRERLGGQTIALLHGWPGSAYDYVPLAEELCAADPSMQCVLISLPGHGRSGQPLAGWGYRGLANVMAALLDSMDIAQCSVHGGDHGAYIGMELARIRPDLVSRLHVSMLHVLPLPEEVADMDDSEAELLNRMANYNAKLSGYMKLFTTTPLTAAYGLADSPLGALAWIAEKFRHWSGGVGEPDDEVSLDAILDIVTLDLLQRHGVGSGWIFYEAAQFLAGVFDPANEPEPITVPMGLVNFSKDFIPIERLARHRYPNIEYWGNIEGAGHFGSLTHPRELAHDICHFLSVPCDE